MTQNIETRSQRTREVICGLKRRGFILVNSGRTEYGNPVWNYHLTPTPATHYHHTLEKNLVARVEEFSQAGSLNSPRVDLSFRLKTQDIHVSKFVGALSTRTDYGRKSWEDLDGFIYLYRAAHALTQNELAERAEVDPELTYPSGYEN